MAAHAVVLKTSECINSEERKSFLKKRLQCFLKSCWRLPTDFVVKKADKLESGLHSTSSLQEDNNHHLCMSIDRVMDMYVKTLGEGDVINTIKHWLLHTQRNINTGTTDDSLKSFMNCCSFLRMFIAALGQAKYQVLESLFDVCDSFISQGMKVLGNTKKQSTKPTTSKNTRKELIHQRVMGLFIISMCLYHSIVLSRNGNCQRYKYWLVDKFFKTIDASLVSIVIKCWMATLKLDALSVILAHKQVLSENLACSEHEVNKLKINYISMVRHHIDEQKLKPTRQHKLSSGKFLTKKKKAKQFQSLTLISQQTINYVDHMIEELQANGRVLSTELHYYRTMRSAYFTKELLPCLLREPWCAMRQQLLEVLAYRVSPPIISKTQIQYFESKKHNNNGETQDTQCLTPADSPTEVPMIALYHTFCRMHQEIPKTTSEKVSWIRYLRELARDVHSLFSDSDCIQTTYLEITDAMLNVFCNIHFSASAEPTVHLIAIKDVVLKLIQFDHDADSDRTFSDVFRLRVETIIKEQLWNIHRYQLEALIAVATILEMKTSLLAIVNKITGRKSFIESFNAGLFYLECCLSIEYDPHVDLFGFVHYYRCRASHFTIVNQELSDLCEKYDYLVSKFPSELIVKGTKPLDLCTWVKLEHDIIMYASAFFRNTLDNLSWYRHCAKIWYTFDREKICFQMTKCLISCAEKNVLLEEEDTLPIKQKRAWEWLPTSTHQTTIESKLPDETENGNCSSRQQYLMIFLVFIHEQPLSVKRKTAQRIKRLLSNPTMLYSIIVSQ
uniref:Uncharacterized protein n=1 Tax=Aplanochytrium stocchinoi TaxID=215587 RepID=A0A7S3PFA5_9STRA